MVLARLTEGIRLQNDRPTAIVAMACPDFPRYRDLFAQTHNGLDKLGVTLLFVRESGEVQVLGKLVAKLDE